MKCLGKDSGLSCGAWRLEREIGQGAYGVVYLAVGPGGERAAVKVCRRAAVGDERSTRELRGAKLYRSIPHQEGLVRMRELVETEWGFYTVMDLADDEFSAKPEPSADYRPKTLACVIEGEKALPLNECVRLALSLAKGLDALQRHHLLHRDIKPGNVLYVKGQPALSDPGLLVEESMAASLVGTQGYVPPEKFTEAASDIYSLGLTLKAASFGRQLADLDKGPAMEADTGAALFPAWWRILNKATDPTASRRYQSAKALIKDLNALRLRMGIASKLGSWIARAAILAASIGIVVFIGTVFLNNERIRSISTGDETDLVSELHSLRQFKTDTENTFKRAEQETLWNIFLQKGTSHTRHLIKNYTHNIAKIAAIDAANAAVFRERIDKLSKLVEKEEAFHRAIVDLRKVDEGKRKKGIHVTEEYEQAKKINKEKARFHDTEVEPLKKELDAMYERFKTENKNVQFEEMPLEDVLGALHDE